MQPRADRDHTNSKKSNLRILYITPKKNEIGSIFEVLIRRFAMVTVIGLAEDDSILCYSSANRRIRVSRRRLPRTPGQRNPARYLFFLAWLLTIISQLISSKAIFSDVAICAGSASTLLMTPFRKLKAIRKLVYYVGDFFPQNNSHSTIEQVTANLKSKVEEMAYKEADTIWCYTYALKRKALQTSCSNSKVVDVIPPLYFPVMDLPPDMSKPTIVYIGSIRLDAGIDVILEALSRLPNTIQYPTLKLFGAPVDDTVFPQIEQMATKLGIQEQLDVKGFIDLKELQRELQRALCGVAIFSGGKLNYSNYAYPNKVKSYLENGIVALVGNSSTLREHPEFRDCCLFVQETPEAVANAVSFLMRNPEVAHRMGRAGFELALRERDSPSLLRAIEEVAWR
ncbi:MAG: glycosyltransferase [Thaumarchaeota archaeon]|nr:glycosyltransferase [Nitrososphaerota archaeon]MCL5318567.1 glycosyltransferase [Nitrososphaerota archaeon]